MYYALIMAGGSGTRLWPLSRKDRPKQSLALVEERTMFQVTAHRLHPLIPLERVYVVTNASMAAIFKEQVPGIPEANYIIEPSAKDNGPAVGLALTHIGHHDPEATVAILTADHHIGKTGEFHRALRAAYEVAQRGYIATLGIQPVRASTAFGYIERGEALGTFEGLPVFRAVRFTEKPDQATAEAYLAEGRHFWNSGMFIMRCQVGMREYERQQPAFAQALARLKPTIGGPEYEDALQQAWAVAPKKSIDYAIMEGAEHVAVIPVDIAWSDIGSWASLRDILPKDEHGNVFYGSNVLAIETHNTLVRSGDKLIAVMGVKDIVVIDTPDALLVCALDRVNELKRIVEQLREQQRDDLL
jgi:mannose-1-phosphate guanylyltransferase